MSFISYLVNGLSLGSVYALIAFWYTDAVYGIAKMLNFAHGDVGIMIGAYVVPVSMNQGRGCRFRLQY